MLPIKISVLTLLGRAACTAAQRQQAATATAAAGAAAASISPSAFAEGQLFCELITEGGPLVVALLRGQGAVQQPVTVTGQFADTVAAECAAWNTGAVPVAPPATAVPTAEVPPPPF